MNGQLFRVLKLRNKIKWFIENTLFGMISFLFLLSFTEKDLEKFIEEVLKASKRGISALKNATSEPNWTFGQALFFTTTVVTTIGKKMKLNQKSNA